MHRESPRRTLTARAYSLQRTYTHTHAHTGSATPRRRDEGPQCTTAAAAAAAAAATTAAATGCCKRTRPRFWCVCARARVARVWATASQPLGGACNTHTKISIPHTVRHVVYTLHPCDVRTNLTDCIRPSGCCRSSRDLPFMAKGLRRCIVHTHSHTCTHARRCHCW